MNWLLPEHFADVLPAEAMRIENLRRRLLDYFRSRGFAFVMPPLMEYLESLLTGAGQDLGLKTFKLVDQLSGRTLGVRADMTPQIARIDAHILNREGVVRLCYCGSVAHTRPASIRAGRELQQIGAEIFGCADLQADWAIVDLMAGAFAAIEQPVARIDLNHAGVFAALVSGAGLDGEAEDALMADLQRKDVPALRERCAGIAEPWRQAILALPRLYGEVSSVLSRAEQVFAACPSEQLQQSLSDLACFARARPNLNLSIDLADLTGYHYHNGIVFAAYCHQHPTVVARGGRYDGAGQAFGRPRAATGFSLDLREVASLMPAGVLPKGIFSPAPQQCAVANTEIDASEKWQKLSALISQLRAKGEIIIEALGDETPSDDCDRQLIWHDDSKTWQLVSL